MVLRILQTHQKLESQSFLTTKLTTAAKLDRPFPLFGTGSGHTGL